MADFKNKIGLIVDEGADLTQELIQKYRITVVPFKIDLGEMANLSGNIYQKIRGAEKRGMKSFVKTSQPSVGDFLSAFNEKFKSFERVICITITSKHSGTFNSALQAKKFLAKDNQERVFIVDSLGLSVAEGLLVLAAADLIEKGLGNEDVFKELQKMVREIKVAFVLEDPKWVAASGRIPRFLASWISKMQRIGIRPILGLKNGTIKAIGIKWGVKDMASALFKEFNSKASKDKLTKIAISHADNLEEMKKLKKMVEERGGGEIILINIIGNVLGGLAGPGALAIAWH